MGERFQLKITGGGPWGFRLQGGDAQPILISKIRKRSKADLAGLVEGDILLRVNGVDVESMSHAAAMETVEASGEILVMEIYRAAGGQSIPESQVKYTTRKTVTESVNKDDVNEKNKIVSQTTTKERKIHGGYLLQSSNNMNQPKAIPDFKVKDVKSTKEQGARIVDTQTNNGNTNLTKGTDAKENVAPLFSVKKYERPLIDSPTWQPTPDPVEVSINDLDEAECSIPKVMPATPGLLPIDMNKLVKDPGFSLPETPTKLKKNILSAMCVSGAPVTKREKLYADSAFFDDATAQYPTVEEQIDLARKVAQVLTSEATVLKSKGAKMFNKRRERSEKWIHAGDDDEDDSYVSPIIIPGKNFPYKLVMQKAAKVHYDPEQPIDHLPPHKVKISSQELEQMRLRSPKVDHNAVEPETCFNLAAALHASKGKGGAIFAKRRLKSESWVVDESNVQSPTSPPAEPQSPKFMKPIDTSKPAKSPWEAAEESGGGVEAAFDHIKRRHTVGSEVFKNMKNASQADIPIDKCNLQIGIKEGKQFKNFNRRARGWGGGSSEDAGLDGNDAASSHSCTDSNRIPQQQQTHPKIPQQTIQQPMQQHPPRRQGPPSPLTHGAPRPAGGLHTQVLPRRPTPQHGPRSGYVPSYITAGGAGGSDL